MEENGSEGIYEVIQAESAEGKFLHDVDFFCISVRILSVLFNYSAIAAVSSNGWILNLD
jgi:hypothetical protein